MTGGFNTFVRLSTRRRRGAPVLSNFLWQPPERSEAANNLVPIFKEHVWLLAFAFGFVHALGFASALSGQRLAPVAMAASLGGFDVGV